MVCEDSSGVSPEVTWWNTHPGRHARRPVAHILLPFTGEVQDRGQGGRAEGREGAEDAFRRPYNFGSDSPGYGLGGG